MPRRPPVTRPENRAPDIERDPGHFPPTHDSRARAEAVAGAPTFLQTSRGATIRIGISAWTEPTLTAPGVFYPPEASSPEARLRYYATKFPIVEVDSGFYAIPSPETAQLWAERTPENFIFDVKAFALMTGHATDPRRLPKILRDALPDAQAEAARIEPRQLPPEILDESWRLFLGAMRPLRDAGKLGAILLQYGPWFGPTREHLDEILRAQERLGDFRGAVELRHRGWFEGRIRERTFELFAEHGIPYVIVDEPQGLPNSVPPIAEVTSPALAMFRFHGRRRAMWGRRNATVQERFRYLYDQEELADWVRPVREAATKAAEVHAIFNNCHGNYATTNAVELAALLAGVSPRTTPPSPAP